MELVENAFKVVAGADGVAVEPANARLWKGRVQPFFNLLRTRTEKMNMLAIACGAVLGHGLAIAAVMALHALRRFMKGHGNRAVLALQRLTAGTAEHDGRIPAAIQQDHCLLAALKALSDFLNELAREYLVSAGLLEFKAHVHQLDFRKRPALHALRELDQPVLPFFGIVI